MGRTSCTPSWRMLCINAVTLVRKLSSSRLGEDPMFCKKQCAPEMRNTANDASLWYMDDKDLVVTHGGACCDVPKPAADVQVLFASGWFTKLAASFVKKWKGTRFHKTCSKFCGRFCVVKHEIYKTYSEFCFCVQVLFTVSIGLSTLRQWNSFLPLCAVVGEIYSRNEVL